MTGGLTRLASRTKVKKEESAKQRSHPPKDHALAYMQDHVQLVRLEFYTVNHKCYPDINFYIKLTFCSGNLNVAAR